MLITKELTITWNPKNIKWYTSKGYCFTKIGDTFIIPIKDISLGCTQYVDLLCDYCKVNIKSIKYVQYINGRKNNKIQKDCCDKCVDKKHREAMDLIKENNIGKTHYFVKQGIIKEKGYWNKRENRLLEVDKYLKKYKTLDNYSINKTEGTLIRNLTKYGELIYDMAIELGYNINEILTYKPVGWYNNFNNLKNDILILIDKFGYFPSLQEIFKELKISNHIIDKYGGINNIKSMLNYNDINDLKDKSGYYNRSKFELWTANFLLDYDVIYERESKPFNIEDGQYRSDFKISIIQNHKNIDYYVEVWGYTKSSTNVKSIEYNKIRDIKENLYKKYKYQLISIEPEVFINKKYEDINKSLYNIFKHILNKNYNKYIINNYIPANTLSDEELLTEALLISNNKNQLPSSKDLVKEKYGIYKEIIRRYNNYKNFAQKYGKNTMYVNKNYWSDINNLFNIYNYMINKYDKILTQKENKELSSVDNNLNKNMYAYVIKLHGGVIQTKLKFFENNLYIPNKELEYIKNVSNKIGRNIKNKVTSEQQQLAKQILDKYNNSINTNIN